jgi:hypothetical protein
MRISRFPSDPDASSRFRALSRLTAIPLVFENPFSDLRLWSRLFIHLSCVSGRRHDLIYPFLSLSSLPGYLPTYLSWFPSLSSSLGHLSVYFLWHIDSPRFPSSLSLLYATLLFLWWKDNVSDGSVCLFFGTWISLFRTLLLLVGTYIHTDIYLFFFFSSALLDSCSFYALVCVDDLVCFSCVWLFCPPACLPTCLYIYTCRCIPVHPPVVDPLFPGD